jgi:hypothetical protein
MASTYTPLGIELQATGENAGTWGTKTNTNLSVIEQISGGYIAKSIAGGAQTTALTVNDGSTGAELAHRMIEFTGSITGNQIVTIPIDVQNFYILRNSTSGAYTVQFKYASGSGDSFTFSTTNKGDKIVFATANDGTNPDIDTLAIGTGISDVVDDTTPQLGGDLDTNSFNIKIDDAHFIADENGLEQIIFQTTASAVNELEVTNAATGNPPILGASGETNVDLHIKPKGSGEVRIGTGAAAATLTTSGAHDLVLDTNSGTNSGTITITDAANGNIDLTPNGTGDVTLQADTVQIGDNNANATLTTQGTGDLILNTNNGTNAGNITLADGANGNIDVSTNGTGYIKFNDLAYIPQQALTSSSNAVAWDVQAKPNAFHLTTENTTFSAPTNSVEGSFVCLEINYNGSHTIAFNTVFEFAASTAPTFTSADGKADILVFRYNGAVWQEVGRTLNLSES